MSSIFKYGTVAVKTSVVKLAFSFMYMFIVWDFLDCFILFQVGFLVVDSYCLNISVGWLWFQRKIFASVARSCGRVRVRQNWHFLYYLFYWICLLNSKVTEQVQFRRLCTHSLNQKSSSRSCIVLSLKNTNPPN